MPQTGQSISGKMAKRKQVVPWLLVVLLAAAFVSLSIYTFGIRQQDDSSKNGNSNNNSNSNSEQSNQQRGKATCGYDACTPTKSDVINIHLIAHTHDDVGWLKTVDQYYFNEKKRIQNAGVEEIIDSVVHSLLRNPKRRFSYAEAVFFFKWWKKQTQQIQAEVKNLVADGRLEIIGGGWSMNDEATTNYQGIIDQLTLGLRYK